MMILNRIIKKVKNIIKNILCKYITKIENAMSKISDENHIECLRKFRSKINNLIKLKYSNKQQ